MAITPDQRATLQLLLERGQSYSDLAALLGVEETEVRARARAALTELGGADPDRTVALTDYLVGQADPIDRADASRHLREDAADHELATKLVASLRALFPAAGLPRLPGEPRSGRFTRKLPAATKPAAAGSGSTTGRRPDFSDRRTRLLAGIAAGAAVLVVAVFAITGAFGGSDDSSASETASASTPDASTTAATPDEEIQTVQLTAVAGGDATAEAVFGLATGDQPYINMEIQGLDPAPQGQTYVIWLMLNETQGYPLSPIEVSSNGTFSDRFAIPSPILPVVARVRFVDVSIASVADVRKLVGDAIRDQALVLEKPGDTVLRGEIPAAQDSAQGAEGSGGAGAGPDPGGQAQGPSGGN